MGKKVLGWIGTAILAILILLVAFMFIGPRFGWETHPVQNIDNFSLIY